MFRLNSDPKSVSGLFHNTGPGSATLPGGVQLEEEHANKTFYKRNKTFHNFRDNVTCLYYLLNKEHEQIVGRSELIGK